MFRKINVFFFKQKNYSFNEPNFFLYSESIKLVNNFKYHGIIISLSDDNPKIHGKILKFICKENIIYKIP